MRTSVSRSAISALFLICGAGVVLANDCDVVMSAYMKLSEVPAYRQVTTMQGKPLLDAMVIDDMMYIRNEETWTKLPMGPGMRSEMMRKVIPDAASLTGCKASGSETLEGIETRIYDYQPPPMEGVDVGGPQRVWIGSADGLPHRMSSVQLGKAIDVRITYTDISAPIP